MSWSEPMHCCLWPLVGYRRRDLCGWNSAHGIQGGKKDTVRNWTWAICVLKNPALSLLCLEKMNEIGFKDVG